MAEQPLICYVEVQKGSRNKYEYDSDLGVDGWYSREDALAEIESARQRRAEGAYR